MNTIKIAAIAAAEALAAVTAAAAQAQTSNVTLYGIMDAGLVRESGGAAGTLTKLTSGVAAASRLGLRGVEDLGGGNAAIFTLESGLKIDSGETDVANTLFNRQAYVGLKTGHGTLTFGRQYTPLFWAVTQVADPFRTGYVGNAKSLLPTAGIGTRTSNTVYYLSPEVHGFSVDLAYALGEQAGDAAAGRQIGGSLRYAGSKLNARLVVNHRNSDVAASAATPTVPAVNRDIGTNILLATNYDFGSFKGYVTYGRNRGYNSAPIPVAAAYGGTRPTPSTASRDLLLGFQLPLGAGTLMGMYLVKDDRTRFNQDARQASVAYSYPLSKRTDLYAAYGYLDNRNGAGYTVVNSSESGSATAPAPSACVRCFNWRRVAVRPGR
jgi:predicted porin